MRELLGTVMVALLTCGMAMGQAAAQTAGGAGPTPSTERPDITNGPVAEYITDSAATIGWSTTAPAKMTVRYGTDLKNMTKTGEATEGRDPRNHHVQLTGLAPNTRYFFQVMANGEPLRDAGTFSTVERGDPPTKSKAIIPQ